MDLKLTHVAVRVRDLEASVRFYCEALGLKEKFRLTREDGAPWLVYVQISERQFIEFFGGGSADQPEGLCGPVHFCLEVPDINQAFEKVKQAGIKLLNEEPHLGADGAWQFWIEDPDHNRIEFHQFTPDSRQLA